MPRRAIRPPSDGATRLERTRRGISLFPRRDVNRFRVPKAPIIPITYLYFNRKRACAVSCRRQPPGMGVESPRLSSNFIRLDCYEVVTQMIHRRVPAVHYFFFFPSLTRACNYPVYPVSRELSLRSSSSPTTIEGRTPSIIGILLA